MFAWAVLDVLLVRAQIAVIGCVSMGCVRCVACVSTDCCDRLCLHAVLDVLLVRL